ncbi:MAG: bifunctional methylenetetrahydrofolate dehydrogenase/methenyltetrahydrofolate cyclohydrolase FolD [Nitrospinae bacterium]|nr:bifunctional methylenetetrahydrofolate dehydrogenase/methenyltetrahydrofolate cyclohydrolase FolD [Nitrospinota bacterium]
MTVKIDGKAVAASIRAELKVEADRIKKEKGDEICLAVVLVGDNPASHVYVRLKEKACHEAGFISVQHTLPKEISMEELLSLIERLNNDPKVNGILVQLPLPAHLDESKVLDRIDVDKDVDGFHPLNVGLLSQKLAKLMPCTPAGCVELLDRYHIPIEGSHAVIVGRSNIVGKPVAVMLIHRNATVTICHSRSKNLAQITSQADILVAAIGKPNFITRDMVKEGAAVIDVGTTKVGNNIVGDVDYANVYDKAGWITPVPGGVGPMTIAMLMYNTMMAYKIQRKLLV